MDASQPGQIKVVVGAIRYKMQLLAVDLIYLSSVSSARTIGLRSERALMTLYAVLGT